MVQVADLLFEIGQHGDRLLAASLVLAALLAVRMLCNRRLYRVARDEQQNTAELIEHLSEGIYRSSLDGRQLSANPALVRLNGYDNETEMLGAVEDIAVEWYVEAGRRDEFREILHREGRVEDFVSEIFRHKTRERIWITESARIVHDKKSGKPLYYEGSVREITETVQRLKLEEQFRKLTRQVPGGLFQMVRHPDGRFSVPFLSSGFRKIAGMTEDEDPLDPGEFARLVDERDRARYGESLRVSGMAMEPWNCEFRARSLDGDEKWLRATAKPEAVEDGIIWHGYLADISLRKRQEMEIEELAYFDPLTGLPNRRRFLGRMEKALAARRERGGNGALLFIDLDNFKSLNDTRGHDVGDAFLVQVARRLGASVAADDMVARIGGDEFVVVLEPDSHDEALCTRHAITVANRILAALRDSFELGSLRYTASASIGVVVFDGREDRPGEILKRADIAMYQAKAAGRDGMVLFDRVAARHEAGRADTLAAASGTLEATPPERRKRIAAGGGMRRPA